MEINLQEYYHTKHWINFSKKLLEDKDCTCKLCSKKRWKWLTRKKIWKRQYRFVVHHLDYDHLNDEENNPECYMTLCYTCHDIAHLIFRQRNSILYNELAEVLEKYGFKFKKQVGTS